MKTKKKIVKQIIQIKKKEKENKKITGKKNSQEDN